MGAASRSASASAALAALLALLAAGVDADADAASAAAAATPTATSYFMAGNPHVPLAVVSHGVARDAVDPALHGKSCGARARWALRGSRWKAIDPWGKVVGTYAMDDLREAYDATACIEEQFVGAPAKDSTLLFVSADSPWREPASAEWTPTRAEKASLLALAADLSRGQPPDPAPPVLTEIAETTRFFAIPSATGAPIPMAVSGRCGGWLVAARVHDRWSIVTRELQARKDQRECFRPVAVFDMSGDGIPEIVMRFSEGGGEWWGERVLWRSGLGTWTPVALSPGGSTA